MEHHAHDGGSSTFAGSGSDLALCLQSFLKDGRAVVSPKAPSPEDSDALPFLTDLDRAARQELALPLPAFSAESALWAARLWYQLCRFVVCRDLGEDEINAACSVTCPEGRGPETDWSADLTLRHLPRMFQLARHLSNADPLLKSMRGIAVAWPLSSVGIPDLENLSVKSFIHDSGLRRLYCDRIIATGDVSRLGDQRVDDALRADLGLHHDLAPALAPKLFATNESH